MNESVQAFLDDFADGGYPPEFLARYEALECLGHNDICETLFLRDKIDGSYAVAKCYREKMLCSREDEGDILVRLGHPAIPALLGRYENGEIRCIVREYAEGVPLSDLSGRLSAGEALDVMGQLCEVLSYLHSRTPPVIHRDIKPQNLVLGPDGRVRIIDFGISRSYDETASADTISLGTREFSPPEQYGFAQTDHRADIYAAGVLLRWLLTGSTDPIQGRIANRRLERIASKCTAFAPGGRYQSAEALRHALLWAGEHGHRQRRNVLTAAALILACSCGFWLGRVTTSTDGVPAAEPGVTVIQAPKDDAHSSGFVEPLIEQAVRLSLGLEDGSIPTEAQLKGVRTLYVIANSAFATEQEFCDYINDIYQRAGTVPRGTVTSLADLERMPNLEKVRIVGEHITDISPLASCPYIVDLELKHNDFSDLSPLKDLDKLENLILMDTLVTDLSPLYGKTSLRRFELKKNPAWDKSQVANLSDEFEELDVNGAGPFLDGKTIHTLLVNQSEFNSMADLAQVSGLRSLRAEYTRLSDLSGIEIHTELESLNISHTAVTDLTPLLALPNLYELVLDEIQRPYAEALKDKPGLTIRYEG